MSNFWWLILANVAWLFAIFDSLKRFERYIIKHANFSLFNKNSKLDRIILAIFGKTKNKYSKFVFYSFAYEMSLAIIQIPFLICIYIFKIYLNNIFVISYLISLLILGFWPETVANVFRMIYYFRSKKTERDITQKKGKNILSKGLDYKKILQKKFAISDAINKYVFVENFKKKYYITPENIAKVNSLIEKKFPYAHTQEWIDKQGIKIFEVYFEHKKERISVINLPVCTK